MATKIPGIKAVHRIISDKCRGKSGSVGEHVAIVKVAETVQQQVEKSCAAWPVGKGAKIHVVVTVEYTDE